MANRDHLQQFKPLEAALRQEAEKTNLFSEKDREKILEKHVPDALAVEGLWKAKPGEKALDLGTGGGIPGLALAIEQREIEWTLLDSRAKKLESLKRVIETLGLSNVRTLEGRAEDLAHDKKYREKFQVVCARAVAPLPVLLEYISGFLQVEGHFYAWKSQDYAKELHASEEALKKLGLELQNKFEYTLPTGEERIILEFIKLKSLSPNYPRRAGLPKKKPL